MAPWADKKINLLELGVHTGGSLLLWRDYFPMGTIVGVDIKLPASFPPQERIHVFEGSQADTEFLSRVANDMAPDGFDIIIDDASHIGELTKTAFWHLFDNHLKPSGLYAIEDWGTGYWDDWADGKSLDLETYRRPASRGRSLWDRIARRLRPKAPLPCHSYGMAGFIKQLVDEQAAYDVTKASLRGEARRHSKFESALLVPSIAFITKASPTPSNQ